MFRRLGLRQGFGKMRSPNYFRGSFFPYVSSVIGLMALKITHYSDSELVPFLMFLELE